MWLLAQRAGLSDQLNPGGGILAQVTLDQETGTAGSGFVASAENAWGKIDDAAGVQFTPIHHVKIVGPGMRQILTVDAIGSSEITAYERERWSRAMGGLGGIEVWDRFVNLRYCIIGVGRSGSLFAQSLSKAGVRHLTLIDPDRVELHNLDAMDCVGEGDLGQYKVDAIQSHLQGAASPLGISSVAGSALSEEAWEPMTTADVLISCVDNNAARLLVGGIASVYAKPILDVGTGIFAVDGARTSDRRTMGADVRLIVPGDGCLLCIGGIRDPRESVTALRNELQGIAAFHPPWQARRAGSLRSLNETAVHLGLGLLENLVAGTLEGSTWLRLEYPPYSFDARPKWTLLPVLSSGTRGLKYQPVSRLVAEAVLYPKHPLGSSSGCREELHPGSYRRRPIIAGVFAEGNPYA